MFNHGRRDPPSSKIVRIILTDPDATDFSSDDEQQFRKFKSKKQVKEISFHQSKPKIPNQRQKMNKSPLKSPESDASRRKKFRGVRQRPWGRWAAEIRDSEAIVESRISIVVFSRNYASSAYCLDQIMEIYDCMKTKAQIVLPVFYGVDPSEVRKQSAGFGEFFKKHEEDLKGDVERVKKWRVAATEFANLSGWDLHNR